MRNPYYGGVLEHMCAISHTLSFGIQTSYLIPPDTGTPLIQFYHSIERDVLGVPFTHINTCSYHFHTLDSYTS